MLQGTFTALITPFTANGEVDYAAYKALVERQIGEGISGLVPLGTTGESPAITHGEFLKIVELTVETAGGRVPVIVGAGANSTRKAVELSREAKAAGAGYTLQVAPYYNKPMPEGLYRHFTQIADSVDIPLIVYNIKARCGINIDTGTLIRMAAHPNIVGVKEASGDFGQMLDVLRRRPGGFSVLSGDDKFSVPLVLMGGDGLISVASNIIPGRLSQLIGKALDRTDIPAVTDEYNALADLFAALTIETNPIPVKEAAAMLGICEPVFRLPICRLEEKNRNSLIAALKAYGLV